MNESIDQLTSHLESKAHLDEADVLNVIAAFNHAMLGNVEGPDCTDKATCKNNCCSIMIDIPHVLANIYITQGWLVPGDVRRGDVFAWKLNVLHDTSRCAFFSPRIYGCRIYVADLGARPPQCAVYPAGYTAGAERCKAGAGPWLVRDVQAGAACERLMGIYKLYCIVERERIRKGLIASIPGALDGRFSLLLGDVGPSTVAGIKETWQGFEPLLAEGRSLSFKQFCVPGCEVPFLECRVICRPATENLLRFLRRVLPAYVFQLDMREEYTIIDLKEFSARAGLD